GKCGPIPRAMSEFDLLFARYEKYRMVADDTAAPHDGESDGIRHPGARAPLPRVDRKVPQRMLLCGGDAFAEGDCRAGGCVDLVAVVSFRDLDVVVLAQRRS